jgi:hypothetical protein
MSVDQQIKETTEKAVFELISSEVIAKLSGPAKDEILSLGVSKVLSGYEFKNAVEKQVERAIILTAQEILRSPRWSEQIRQAVEAGIEELLLQIPRAVFTSTLEALFGTEGENYYDKRPSMILKHLNLKSPEDK